jgi:molybdopterin converting factor subunit 1
MVRPGSAKHATSPGVNVVVFYFAALRDLLGRAEERLELPEGIRCVADLARHLSQRHPQLEPHLGSVRFAINESFVDLAAPLANGDVVALIPPVTGG